MTRRDKQELASVHTDGDPVMDASYLAAKFGISQDALRMLLQKGLVRSKVEIGHGDDAGRRRLTVRIGNRQWVAVMDDRHRIVFEELRFVTRRR